MDVNLPVKCYSSCNMLQKVNIYGIISGGFPCKRQVTSCIPIDSTMSFHLEYTVIMLWNGFSLKL